MFELATGLIAEDIGLGAHILNTVERHSPDWFEIHLIEFDGFFSLSLPRFIDDSQIQLELNQFEASRRLAPAAHEPFILCIYAVVHQHQH